VHKKYILGCFWGLIVMFDDIYIPFKLFLPYVCIRSDCVLLGKWCRSIDTVQHNSLDITVRCDEHWQVRNPLLCVVGKYSMESIYLFIKYWLLGCDVLTKILEDHMPPFQGRKINHAEQGGRCCFKILIFATRAQNSRSKR